MQKPLRRAKAAAGAPIPSPLLTTACMTIRYEFQTEQGMREKEGKR